MASRIEIDLKNRVQGGGAIEFLRAETSATTYTPFAIVRYTIDGVEQEYGLRLDMDKQVFLDHFDDEQREAIVQDAAPVVSWIVGDYLISRDCPPPPGGK